MAPPHFPWKTGLVSTVFPQREQERELWEGLAKVSLGKGQFLFISVGTHISLLWAQGLPVEEARLAPEHHHHIAACIQVGAGDGNLCAPGHGSPAGLQVCEGQSLHRKEED